MWRKSPSSGSGLHAFRPVQSERFLLFIVRDVFFVIAAEVLQQIFVRDDGCFLRVGDGFRVVLWIVDGRFDFEMPGMPLKFLNKSAICN